MQILLASLALLPQQVANEVIYRIQAKSYIDQIHQARKLEHDFKPIKHLVFNCTIVATVTLLQGRRETGRAPGLGLSWGPTVEGCKNLFWVTPLAMQLDGL